MANCTDAEKVVGWAIGHYFMSNRSPLSAANDAKFTISKESFFFIVDVCICYEWCNATDFYTDCCLLIDIEIYGSILHGLDILRNSQIDKKSSKESLKVCHLSHLDD